MVLEELLPGASAKKASALECFCSRRSARRCPNGRLPRSLQPCRRCAGSISLPPWRYWPRSVISPALQNPRELMEIPRPRTLREAPRAQRAERGWYHQGRQRPCTTHPGGGGLYLPYRRAWAWEKQPEVAAAPSASRDTCGQSANATVQALRSLSSRGKASCGRSSPRRLPVSFRPSSGRSIGRSLARLWGGVHLVCALKPSAPPELQQRSRKGIDRADIIFVQQ